MSITLDIVFLAIVIVCVAVGFKRGVVRSFLSFIGYLAALVGASFLSGWLSVFLYNSLFRNMLIRKITGILTETTASPALEQAQAVLDGLPGFLSGSLQNSGITAAFMSGMVTDSVQTVAPTLADLAGPFVISITKTILVLALFALLLCLANTVVSMISAIFRLPILRQVNSLLGGIFGLFSGGVLVVLCCALLQMCLPFSKDGFLGVTQQDLENSYSYQIIYRDNPIKSLFSEES